jgi:Rod binding domain-containing protein
MASALGLSPALSPAASAALMNANPTAKATLGGKARAAAVDFEAVFLNSMFNQMFTGISGEGPFGGGAGVGVWRTFLTEEYSKSFAKAGGIGLADQVYKSLLAQQEARADQRPATLSPTNRPTP